MAVHIRLPRKLNGLYYLAVRNHLIPSRGVLLTAARSRGKEKMDDLEENPFMAKYAAKMKELQRCDPETFKTRLDARKTKEKAKTEVKTDNELKSEQLSLSSQPQPQLVKGPTQHMKKSLDSIVKLDLLKGLPSEEITRIWRDYHKDKDRICAVIPSKVYRKIQEKSNRFPMFLYALPKKTGYEFFFGQFEGDCSYFTSLVNYQAYQENSPLFLTLSHYTEFEEDKGIVLLTGEINTNFMTVQEAQLLANQVQLYYATDDRERQGLLETFNRKPDEFKHMDVVRLLQSQSVNVEDEGTPIE